MECLYSYNVFANKHSRPPSYFGFDDGNGNIWNGVTIRLALLLRIKQRSRGAAATCLTIEIFVASRWVISCYTTMMVTTY